MCLAHGESYLWYPQFIAHLTFHFSPGLLKSNLFYVFMDVKVYLPWKPDLKAKRGELLSSMIPYVFLHLCIHLFISCILNIFYEPCSVQDPEDTKINNI